MRSKKRWSRALLICFFSALGFLLVSQETATYTTDLKEFKEGQRFNDLRLFNQAVKKYQVYTENIGGLSEQHLTYFSMQSELLSARNRILSKRIGAEKAFHDYIKRNRPDPNLQSALVEIGDYYFNNKQYTEAIFFFDQVSNLYIDESKKSEVAYKLAYCHFVKKEFRKAIQILNEVDEFKNGYYFKVNYYLGMSYYFISEYDDAIHHLDIASSSKTYKTFIPHLLAQIYFNQEKYSEVIAIANKSLEEPDTRNVTEIKGLLGKSYFETNKYEDALPQIEFYIEHGKQIQAEDYYQLGFLYYTNGLYKEAIEPLLKISANEGDIGQFGNFYLGSAYNALGKIDDARNAFATSMRKNPNSEIGEEARFMYGYLSAKLNYDREAVGALLEIKRHSPHYGKSQSILVWIFERTEDYDRAIDILESMEDKSTQLKRAYQRVTFLKALQLIKSNESELAIAYLRKSLNNPFNQEVEIQSYFWLADIQSSLGLTEESKKSLNTYFTLYNNSLEIPEQSQLYIAKYNQGYNYFEGKEYALAQGQFLHSIDEINKQKKSIANPFITDQILSDAYIRSGDCYFSRNETEKALDQYNKAIEIESEGTDYALFQSAMILGLKGDPLEKILRLEKIMTERSKSPYMDDALYELGITYYEIDQPTQAAKPLKMLVNNYKDQSPLTVQAYLKLGLITFNQGDSRGALKNYKKVFDFYPNEQQRSDALTAIEEIYVTDLGEPDEYVEFIESTGVSNIDDVEKDNLNFKSAYSKFEEAKYPEAILKFGEYIAKYPNGLHILQAHFLRAECFLLDEQFEKAYPDYTFILNSKPNQYVKAGAEKAAKIAYHQMELFDAAANHYNDWFIAAKSEEERMEAALGKLQSGFRIKNRQLVTESADYIIQNENATEDKIQTAAYYSGLLAFSDDDFEDALPLLNRCSKNNTSEEGAEARYLVAKIYYTRQEMQLASEMAKLAVQENTSYPFWVAKSLLLVSDISADQNDLLQARAALEAVLENFKEDPEIVQEAEIRLKKISELENPVIPKQDTILNLDEGGGND